MPTYTVQLRINVPGVGERIVDFPGTVAPTIHEAIQEARKSVIIEPLAVQKTGN